MTTPHPRASRPDEHLASPSRLDGALLAGAVVLFVLGYVIALTAPGLSYTWEHNMVSDLGRATCRSWEGWWVCSPRARWFDGFIAAAGACLVVVSARMARLWDAALTFAIASLSVGLLWLAAVPSDSPVPLHMVGAVLALPIPSAGMVASGFVATTAWATRHRRLRLVLGLVALTACLDHLAPPPAPVPRGTAETISVACLLACLLIEAVRAVRAGGRRAP